MGAELFHSDGHTTKLHTHTPKIYIHICMYVCMYNTYSCSASSNPIKCNLYFVDYLVTVWRDADLYMAQQLSPMCKQHMQMLILWCTGDPIGSRKPPLKMVLQSWIIFIKCFFLFFFTQSINMLTVEDTVATVIAWFHRLSCEESISLCWYQRTSRHQLTHFKEQDPLQMRTFRLTIHVPG